VCLKRKKAAKPTSDPQQGDQMILLKSRPKYSPNYWYRGKKVGQKFDLLHIFKALPKVNNCPKGENSPNLVTLIPSQFFAT
jgi:hypothetical protein